MAAQYSPDFIDRLHVVWGQGFLSPGGRDEVREIVRDLALKDAATLDIGSGTGGPALVLAEEFGALVTGVDVESEMIARASALVAAAGVSDRVEIRAVAPGPLPFPDAAFDVVFSKDSLIHIPDKPALYAEILRVLRPGGVFAASDWLGGVGAAEDRAMRRYLELGHLNLVLATADETATAMREAGFDDVTTVDRNGWYAGIVEQEMAAIEGPLRADIIAVSSAAVYAQWRDVRRALSDAVLSGALRPTHLRGRRPMA